MSETRENVTVENMKHKASRLFALDALRGLIIVFMALDHANHFVAHKHSPGEFGAARSRSTTTRWRSSLAW